MRRGWSWGASLAVAVVVVAGCSPSGPDEDALTTAPPVSTPTAPTSTPSGDVTPTESAGPTHPADAVSVEAAMPLDWSTNLGAVLTAWVYPVQRSTAEGLSLVTVVIERPADGGPSSSGFMQNLQSGANVKPTGLVLVDAATGTAATPLRVGESWAASSDTTEIAAGGSLTATVAFPPVSAGATTVQVLVPGFDLVEVPVVEQDSSTWPDDAKKWAGSPAKVGAFAPVESSAMSLVTQSTVEVAGDQVVVDLPADVLFAFDKSALSAKAQKVVDKAGRKIAEAAAASGEITVVGHTDDQGAASYNAKLSKARAEAVAKRLRPILGAGFTVKTEGKGSSQPRVKGTSEEARAANRRVEIAFTGRSANKLVVVDDVPTDLPATKGVVVSGTETAHVPASILNPELDARMVSLRRTGSQLVGVLEIAAPNVRAESAAMFGDTTLQRRGFAAREFSNLSIANVNLLSATVRTFSSSFRPGGDETASPRLVGSQVAEILPVPDGPHRYVLVWPDVDPEATSVTIDAPDAYRFLDVPIS